MPPVTADGALSTPKLLTACTKTVYRIFGLRFSSVIVVSVVVTVTMGKIDAV